MVNVTVIPFHSGNTEGSTVEPQKIPNPTVFRRCETCFRSTATHIWRDKEYCDWCLGQTKTLTEIFEERATRKVGVR